MNESRLRRKISPVTVAYVSWAPVFLGWGLDIVNRLLARFVPNPSVGLHVFSDDLYFTELLVVALSPFLALVALAQVSRAVQEDKSKKRIFLRIFAVAVVLFSFAVTLKTCSR